MKDIKFRAWDKSMQFMHDEIYISGYGGVFVHPEKYHDTPHTEIEHDEGNLVVMQFTGLTDKNGVEIYENDVLRAGDDSFYGLVYFDEKDAVFGVKIYKDGKKVMNCASVRSFIVQREVAQLGSHCVVIGNRFEDKDLIKND